MMKQPVVLASGSPRRSELLTRMGVPFCVDAADVDETISADARETVLALARRKALAVAPRHPDRIILAADTVVDCDGILGKPVSRDDAFRMLRMLTDRWHTVYTGVCTVYGSQIRCEAAQTRVHFTPIPDALLWQYIDTGDPMDKAGAYAIQGMAGMFIDQIDGCPHNVMGLPMALTLRLLAF